MDVEILKTMNAEQKTKLAAEIRMFLLKNISKTGGHLASNLGVVELTLAMHSVFSSQSEIIWDVGHQSYVHKILTGRASGFSSLRQLNGLSGFPKRKESERDCFDTGHSTTSISAAVGISVAKRMKGDMSSTYVVIGDGALTGGMAYESLNHLGSSKENVKIILNDNQMSISRNVGGLVNALRSTSKYNKIKKGTKSVLQKIPIIGRTAEGVIRSIKRAIRSFFVGQGQIFEELGIKYLGKVDGHSLEALEKALKHLDEYDGPAILHVFTVKGKGYGPAEEKPEIYHGVGSFDLEKGIGKQQKTDFSSVFGSHLTQMAETKRDIVAISAAMIDGTGLSVFSERYPGRIFDVGIAEQHAVTFAAGLAVKGIRPFVAIYSTFLQRAYDQMIHDVCLQNLPVVFCVDRAGVVGADGETHHGVFDISYFGAIPNMTVLSVSNYDELRRAMDYAYTLTTPVAVRYPRGGEVSVCDIFVDCFDGNQEFEYLPGASSQNGDIADNAYMSHDAYRSRDAYSSRDVCSNDDAYFGGKGGKAAESNASAIVTTGRALKVAKDVQDELRRTFGLSIPVYNIVKIKPFSCGVRARIKKYHHVFTIEDHMVQGGFGDLVRNELRDGAGLYKFGFSDYVPHGTQDELYEHFGLSSKIIAERIAERISEWERDFEEKA